MATSFKVECFREQRLGIVLDPCKGSSYYYVKNDFSKDQSIENQNVRTTRSSPGEMKTFYATLHRPFLMQTAMSSVLVCPDARVSLVPVKRGSSDDSKVYMYQCVFVYVYCVCIVHIYVCEDTDSYRNPHKLAVAEPLQPLRFEG